MAKLTERLLPKNRRPTHPGEMLLNCFLEPLGISQAKFARHVGWPHSKMQEIVSAHRRVTVASAMDLADAIGMTADFWLHLQTTYDLWHALRGRKKIGRIYEKD